MKISASKDNWGAEDLIVTDGWLEGNSLSDIMETYLERVVGDGVFAYYGRWFPLMVKFTDVGSRFPLRVHPDDETAEERYDSLGKSECWYVLDAEPGAKIFMGFNRDVTAQEFYDRCAEGTVEEVLNVIYPKKGDMIFVKPGTVHAPDAGIRLLEIQENSDLNFLLYGWNAGASAETDLEEAIDVIDYQQYGHMEHDCCCHEDDCHCHEDGHDCHCHGEDHHHEHHAAEGQVVETLIESPQFNVTKLNLTDPLHIYTEKFGSFIIYTCIEGAASIQVPSTSPDDEAYMENYEFRKGESILVPAEMPDLYLVPRDPSTVLIEATTMVEDEVDGYIDPNTEAFLEGEDYEGLEDGAFEDDDDAPSGPVGASPLNFFS